MKYESSKLLEGQPEIWQLMLGFMDLFALKCVVELGIPDILHSHNRSLSLAEIASNITNVSSSPNIHFLSRVMNLLVYRKVFTATSTMTSPNPSANGGDADPSSTLYGPTAASKWLICDNNALSLAPMVIMALHPSGLLTPWQHMSRCILEGGNIMKYAYGCEMWERAAKTPELNKVFNEAMATNGNITVQAIMSGLKEDAWEGLETVVDVGGGTGETIAEIVKAYPHIKGINFDLPHVVATAPEHIGVSHVGGDMFDAIPSCQAVFMKWILHDWSDEKCMKILQNCRKAIPEKTGKIFIVDLVLKHEGDEIFGGSGLAFDLMMHAAFGGKERTKSEWKNLLEKTGFGRYKINQVPGFYSVIEAYPN